MMQVKACARFAVVLLFLVVLSLGSAVGQDSEGLGFSISNTGAITLDGEEFDSWKEFAESELFQDRGLRCGKHKVNENLFGGTTSDCGLSVTDPTDDYDPLDGPVYRIPVVVHVIENEAGVGDLTEEQVESQIEILNEDFRALSGTPGEDGVDTKIEFYLATEDPDGDATDGITYSTDDDWFDDFGAYMDDLNWDPDRYLNIYTNSASGFLGYVNFLPQEGGVGDSDDGVVCLYSAFGRDSSFSPYDQGRTATHEVGHYLGLFHTFDNGCGDADDCYETGDYVCDTDRQSSPNYGCPSSPTSCGTDDPYQNYMDYTDDECMTNFTDEQARRMRCTLEHWRPDLYEIVVTNDNREDAFVMEGDNGSTDASNLDATVEDDEPEGDGGASVWWTWTPSASGTATVDTNGSDFDTTLTVYDGDLEIVAEDDDSGEGTQSEVTFEVDADVELLVRVAGYNDATGDVTLNWALETGPPFLRGDVTEDGVHDLSDIFSMLAYIYLDGSLGCEKAADVDDNNSVDLTDVLDNLGYQFLGDAEPAPPFPSCGGDPTVDIFICDDHAVCL